MKRLKEQRSEQIQLPFNDAAHSTDSTVGEVLDLIEDIQEEESSSSKRGRFSRVGIEFVKIAMAEIPLVGGGLGALDGLYAMYEAGKNEEHTWKDIEEYPILRRMKMHPELIKVLDNKVLIEIDNAYKEHLSKYSRDTKVTQITDIDVFAKEWVMGETGETVEVEVLRECIRRIILEVTGAKDFGGGEISNRENLILDRPSKSRGYMGGKDVTWTGENTSDHIYKWLTDMGFTE
jgi:hypothetical protein